MSEKETMEFKLVFEKYLDNGEKAVIISRNDDEHYSIEKVLTDQKMIADLLGMLGGYM